MEETQMSKNIPDKVVMHPLVLLSVVDHYSRVAKDTDKRVVGILLGSTYKGVVDISNSYAVPFEEDSKNPETWYFDHNYHESMFAMFRKVNSSERVVGWYSTGTIQRKADIHIHEVIRQYTTEPIFTLIDVQNSSASEAPAKAFVSLPAAPDALAATSRVFRPVPTAVGAEEAEEVGVEHLLRDLRGLRHVSLTESVQQQVAAVATLESRMALIADYLDDCAQGRTVPNPKIIRNAQSILAMVPNLAAPALAEALATHQNDSAAMVYVASLVRAVTRLHDLIGNKKMNREAELNENTKRALLAATQLAEDDAEVEGIDMDAVGEPSAE